MAQGLDRIVQVGITIGILNDEYCKHDPERFYWNEENELKFQALN